MVVSSIMKQQKDGIWQSGLIGLGIGWKSTLRSNGSWAEQTMHTTNRLPRLIVIAGACSCLYALMLILTSKQCWHSFQCKDPRCIPSVIPESVPALGETNLPTVGLLRNSSFSEQNQRMRAKASFVNPISIPINGGASAVNPSITNISHILFGIAASASLWEKRKEYTKVWWRPEEMRGFVWLDRSTRQRGWEKSLPPWRISQNTDRFIYANKVGHRSAIRISRIVSESVRLGLPNVHWFVMGDDDTIFIPENLVRVLSKYDHNQYYYIGSNSESHLQNIAFSYNMAYGGGGFAISHPLAKALEKIQDGCLNRYPSLFGGDDRIQACIAELGVPLTKEFGFHQYDVYGNLFGLMATHPVTPVVSIHHLDVVDPIFPNRTRLEAVRHLSKSMKLDPAGFLQQSICYERTKQWSISISWGFAVQVVRGIFSARELEIPPRTFLNWHRRADYTAYAFNTRPVSRHPCQEPVLFYMKGMGYGASDNQLVSNYTREQTRSAECQWKVLSPTMLEWINVVKAKDDNMWLKSPRRKCC
eukprot:c910_g1_i1 orf=646-2238(+)